MSDTKKILRITWVKSGICCKQPHRRTVKALGLHRLNHTVERVDNPAVRGMVNKISYLLKVEEVN